MVLDELSGVEQILIASSNKVRSILAKRSRPVSLARMTPSGGGSIPCPRAQAARTRAQANICGQVETILLT